MDQNTAAAQGRRFGSYLRRIREERRLSLDAVEELSLGYRERVTKSHLSRIENGRAVPTFARLFALSQIYGVPLASLAERFEIDLWRERQAVDVQGLSPEVIAERARALVGSGNYVELLSLASAALEQAAEDPAGTGARFRLYRIDALIHLERYETAKLECETLLGEELPPELRVLALFSFVICCYRLKRFTIADMGLRDAEEALRALGAEGKLRADFELHRAAVNYALGRVAEAAEGYGRAATLYDDIPEGFEACRARVNLGQVLIDEGRLDDARTGLEAALGVAEASGYDRLRALASSHLGVVARLQGDFKRAETCFLRSNAVARTREFFTLLFRNCYHLWLLAQARGDEAAAASNERTLRTYLGRVDADLPEAVAYRERMVGGRDVQH